MSIKPYLTGIITFSALTGGICLIVSPQAREEICSQYYISRETFLMTWSNLKSDFEELLDTAAEMKNSAISLLNERLPVLLERIEQFKKEINPHLLELKNLLLELQNSLENLLFKLKQVRTY